MVTFEDDLLSKVKKLLTFVWLRLLMVFSSIIDSWSFCLMVMERILCM